ARLWRPCIHRNVGRQTSSGRPHASCRDALARRTCLPLSRSLPWECNWRFSTLTNRATSAYAPGSAYKIVTALAGLTVGLEKARFTCAGGVALRQHLHEMLDRRK